MAFYRPLKPLLLLTLSVPALSRRSFNNLKTARATMAAAAGHNLKIVTAPFRRFKAIKCWQCGIEKRRLTDLFCEKCQFIQDPLDKNNFFKIFELPENFDLDQKVLTTKYRQLQSVLHPDKFSNKSEQEKRISEEFSALVNKAYHTLQSPLKRAIHLLNLRGETVEETQKIDSPEFLMEIMELNEEVEGADSAEKLRKLHTDNQRKLAEISVEIKNYFIKNELDKAKESIIKMKYYKSVGGHIDNLMREKGIVD